MVCVIELHFKNRFLDSLNAIIATPDAFAGVFDISKKEKCLKECFVVVLNTKVHHALQERWGDIYVRWSRNFIPLRFSKPEF